MAAADRAAELGDAATAGPHDSTERRCLVKVLLDPAKNATAQG